MPLRWGILATGNIARTFASAAEASSRNTLAAVASRDPERARRFAADYEGVAPAASYDDLLADESIDAVYVATPRSVKPARIGGPAPRQLQN